MATLGVSPATAGVTAVRTLNAEIHATLIYDSPFGLVGDAADNHESLSAVNNFRMAAGWSAPSGCIAAVA
jgi:hypothetical protein